MNHIRCQVALAIFIASLTLSTTSVRADDAQVPSAAASASKAVPAAIYLRGSCAPSYPAAALKAHASGVTGVRFTIEPNGTLAGAEVMESSGPLPENQLLDQAAVDALSKCPIRAGRDENGQPAGAQIVAHYNWVLAPR